jgi:hypothetical protein
LESVSRIHAEFFDRESRLWVRDLRSKNGTFVNGERVSEAAVSEGDVISLADFEFELAPDASEYSAVSEDQTLLFRSGTAVPSRTIAGVRISMPDLRNYVVTGPWSHENLSVYIVTGADAAEGVAFCTLQDALRRGTAVIRETGFVDRVVAENLMTDQGVFIQSGDIVKGGKQDRTVRFDTVVQPSSTVEMQAYCVERRRWHRRGGEDEGTFSGSASTLSTASLRTTIIRGLAQADVWSRIGETQDLLAATIGVDVRSADSPSSYQLTAESQSVKRAIDAYLAALEDVAAVEHAIGAVIAINGTLNRADIYVTSTLFRALWPKLLEGAAVEAVARRSEYRSQAGPAVEVVRSYLEDSREGDGSQQKVGRDVISTTVVRGSTTFYETRILKPTDTWVHQGYVTDEEGLAG